MGQGEAKPIDCNPDRINSILKLDVFNDSEIEMQLGKTWSVLRFIGEGKANDLHLSFAIQDGYATNTHLTCRAIEYRKGKYHISFVSQWNEIEEWYQQCCNKLHVERDGRFMEKVHRWHNQVENNVTVRIEHDEL
ncbi:unnamed protein product [Adineta ricciae]|uniref:Uncharacterized protein n=1 Tax=Adineta ricciae TaxID=249248 RepID=A0A816E3X2_ADIRI|nr:unnamed protein product [Adineta ricciae]CAF1644940.1 unnamed protein product [Adineta ricciae]